MRISRRSYKIWLLLIGIGSSLLSCHKDDFLDKKPNSDNVIPSTLSDFQSLIDNPSVMNLTPAMGELSADNIQFDYAFWQTLDYRQHNVYIWAKDIYNGQGQIWDWNIPYQQVFYANLILEGLSKRTADSISNNPDWKDIKGQALFIRAYAFWNLAQLFGKAYDAVTAGSDSCIPLRLSSEVISISRRSTVSATYQQILQDLLAAKDLLYNDIPSIYLNRASRPAALAMLARVLLSMRDYTNAGLYADSVLQDHNTLIDFNGLTYPSNFPFLVSNPEILYQSNFISNSPQILIALAYPKVIVDTNLAKSYDENDLRKRSYFRATYPLLNYKASYNGYVFPFSGLAVDEMLLIRAECKARAGNEKDALNDLNTLMIKRWKTGAFTPVTAASATDALDSILVARRKELPLRGLRWTDLRRLNKEGRNITLTRLLNGTAYTLPPNGKNYVLPIPPDVTILTGMQNDPRD